MTNRRALLVAAAGALLVGASGCSGGSAGSPSPESKLHPVFPTWGSLDEMKAASDYLALFVAGRIQKRAVDNGGLDEGEGVPVAIWSGSVERSSIAMPKNILIVMPDTESESRATEPTFVNGETYLVFVARVEESNRGGLEGEGTLFVPVGGPGSVFRVESGRARAIGTGAPEFLRPGERLARDGDGPFFDVLAILP